MRKSFLHDDIENMKYKSIAIIADVKSQMTGFIYSIISSILFGLLSFTLKFTGHYFPDYNVNFFVLWRSIIISMISYYFLKRNNDDIIGISEILNNNWFLVRIISNYGSLLGITLSMIYLRGSTAQTIFSLNLLLVVFLSVLILKEKFYIRYIIGAILCTFGLFLIVSNENYSGRGNDQVKSQSMMLFGLFSGLIGAVFSAFVMISQKVLLNQKISNENQMFILGYWTCILSFGCIVITGNYYVSFYVLVISTINALLLYGAMHTYNCSILLIYVSKASPFYYLSNVVVFVLSVVFLNENIFSSDIIGCFIIMIYNIYNTIVSINKD